MVVNVVAISLPKIETSKQFFHLEVELDTERIEALRFEEKEGSSILDWRLKIYLRLLEGLQCSSWLVACFVGWDWVYSMSCIKRLIACWKGLKCKVDWLGWRTGQEDLLFQPSSIRTLQDSPIGYSIHSRSQLFGPVLTTSFQPSSNLQTIVLPSIKLQDGSIPTPSTSIFLAQRYQNKPLRASFHSYHYKSWISQIETSETHARGSQSSNHRREPILREQVWETSLVFSLNV